MFEKVSTDLNFVSREVEIEKFWRENDIFQKSVDQREGQRRIHVLRRPAHGQRQAPHRAHRDPGHQGPDSPVPDHEGQEGAPQGRMGHPRPAGGAGSGKDCWAWTARSRSRNTASSPSFRSARNPSGNTRAMWEKMSDTCGLLGRHGASLHHLRQQLYRIRMVGAQDHFRQGACCTRAIRSCPTAPAAAPPLSSHEVAQGYKDVKERSAVVRFKVKGEENTYLLGLDHHPLDPAHQRGAVRQRQ